MSDREYYFARMPLAGQLIAGKYRLEHQLGAGGMGSVWLATHLELGSKVAVKFQLDHRAESPDAVARFRREARAAAQLRSAHVVHIYDYGLDSGVPYIAMEYLAGESLRARLERDFRLTPTAVTWIVREVAAALDMAHQVGVIHRDIKPANLFIAQDGCEEIVKLLDFGIAKWADPHPANEVAATTTATIVGSAAYMSPEQARGLPLDHRTDLWSLAAVSYEMLTGTPPFAAPSVPATLRKLELGEFESPSSLLGVPTPELDQVFARALAPRIDDRFGTGGQFAQELAQAIAQPTEYSGDTALPEQPRVLGRSHNTATMRSAVVSCSPDRERVPRARALLLGIGALGVVGVIGWMLSAKTPTATSGTPASLVPTADGTVRQRNSPLIPASAASSAVAPAASSAVSGVSSAASAKPNGPAAPAAKATAGPKPRPKLGPLSKDL